MQTTIFNRRGLLALLSILTLVLYACKKNDLRQGVRSEMTITDYYPNSGKAGTLITLAGTGFSSRLDDHKVLFGEVAGEVMAVSKESLIVRAPEGGKSGMITVSNGAKEKQVGPFNYQALTITRIDPANGPTGSHIRIFGEGFSSISSPAKVTINGKVALVGSASDTLLVAEVPPEAGSGPVEVYVDAVSSRGQQFTFQSIRSIKPLTGGKGTLVHIQGEGFENLREDNIVDFNGKLARVLEVSPESLLVEAPEAVETGPLAVTINGQRTTGPIFTQVPFPEITEVSPLSGPKGTEMIINGNFFSPQLDENMVSINGNKIQLISATAKELKLIVPGKTGSGDLLVEVNNQRTKGPHFKDQELGITAISPDDGLTGTKVTIKGTGFEKTPSSNVVTFNGIVAQILTASENNLEVLVPENVSAGIIRIKVGNLEAEAPRIFRKAGIQTLLSGKAIDHIAVDNNDIVYAVDYQKNNILKIDPNGGQSIFAGDPNGSAGNVNGNRHEARFSFSKGANDIVIDKNNNLYVTEPANRAIRKITPNGTVSTLYSNISALDIALGADQLSLIAKISSSSIMRIMPNGLSEPIIPITPIYNITGSIAIDEEGGLYNPSNIEYPYIDYNPIYRKQSNNDGYGDGQYGAYRDGIGLQAQFSGSFGGLMADFKGNILVADDYYIRNINRFTREVTTIIKLHRGDRDGDFRNAQLNTISSFTLGPEGSIYIVQPNNQSIRKIFFR